MMNASKSLKRSLALVLVFSFVLGIFWTPALATASSDLATPPE